MNTTAALIVTFMVCVNVGIYIVHESAVFPASPTAPESITSIQSKLIQLDLSTGNLMIAGTALIMSVIIGRILVGNVVFGGLLGAGLLVFTLVSPIVSWVLFGIPKMMDAVGITAVAPYLTIGVSAVLAVPLAWFVFSMLASRPIKED